MAALQIDDLPAAIRQAKRTLRARLPNYREVFEEVAQATAEQARLIARQRETGEAVIPEIAFADIAAQRVSAEAIAFVKARGACVIRRVFEPQQAARWDAEIADYVTRNDLDARLANRAEDRYFGQLKSSRPQIYGIYWSRPQVLARESAELTTARVFLNRLWRHESDGRVHFDPDVVPAYADRLRRRPPGSASLGLSAHCDGGSVERWIDENFRQVYRHVFSGDWRRYDPFDAAFRPDVNEIPSPAVCSMFRTFQGWTALTPQGPGDGTLQLVPIANAMAYILLRALQDDVADEDLCGAQPGRALSIRPEWHAPLFEALTSIPQMQAGDAVFWHSDVIHAVEDEHHGAGYSNVMYIAAAPGCAKNDAYLQRQLPSFLEGRSPPDFPGDHFEVDFAGRAGVADLTPLGRAQLGLPDEG
ncbi:MAG TPA: DUF1479 domain-containing protein [Paraburkholderia sp.]|uniref:DUF1479 domain-containing protein n=1 Tax=Paraburkholderia sp. TaxID=1926495 RepID=UPI002B894C63|nr:DUF1479 domain-containing protein [Paraburkholderia sp.]HTR06899.1 DUF1479 domain-containing protein [Paraburkholderia sp.]